MQQQIDAFLKHSWRGGNFGLFVKIERRGTQRPRKRYWKPLTAEDSFNITIDPDADTLYCVNPATEQPGDPLSSELKIANVACVNKLFADFDAGAGKSYPTREAALAHIMKLDPPPTTIVDSGHGYHPYWNLKDTFFIKTKEDRTFIKKILKGWVAYVGGDPNAASIHNQLRLPGSFNNKDGDRLPVEIIEDHPEERVYELSQLQKAANLYPERKAGETPDHFDTADIIKRIKGNPKYLALWNGDIAGYKSPSEADLKLLVAIARYTNNPRRIEAVYAQSVLGQRKHWADDEAYRERTISRAVQLACAPANTDDAVATFFVKRHARDILYIEMEKSWYHYDGICWRRDEDNLIKNKVQTLMTDIQETIDETDDPDVKNRQRSIVKRYSGATARWGLLDSAAPSRLIARVPRDFYPVNNQFLVNFRNCTVDWRTGDSRGHRPEDLLLGHIPHDWDEDAVTVALWEDWYREQMPDADVRQQIDEYYGLSCTAYAGQDCVQFHFGVSNTGKTVETNVHEDMLGPDYCTKIPIGYFLRKGNRNLEGPSSALAATRHKRLVITTEMPKNATLVAAKLKDLVSGASQTGRDLHEKQQTWWPTATYILFGNHKPNVDVSTDDLWKRFDLIPWSVVVPEDARVDDYWMCFREAGAYPGRFLVLQASFQNYWERVPRQRHVSKAGYNATLSYRSEQDKTATFIEMCYERSSLKKFVLAHEALKRYRVWWRQEGLKRGGEEGRSSFYAELERLGCDVRGNPKRAYGLEDTRKSWIEEDDRGKETVRFDFSNVL